MEVAYFDCFSGASGDMILGALVDAGLDFEYLCSEIALLTLDHYHLSKKAVTKSGLGGTQVIVSVEHSDHHHHRHLSDIESIIKGSKVSKKVKEKSILVFRRLAEAEAKVHRMPIDQVHFHEVGAIDTIIDVVGAMIGFDALGIDKIYCSPIHLGTGTITCKHGTFPVPAPATAELVRECPVYSTGVDGELLTPTGAAILTVLASEFGPIPRMKVEQIGYGAGTAELAIPNLLRVMIGRLNGGSSSYDIEQVAVVETSIDDMNPQIYDFLIQKLSEADILDIFLSPLQMKKNRPGTLVTVICKPNRVHSVANIIMRETTSIGIRWRLDCRLKARRIISEVSTPYGNIRAKVSFAGKEIVKISPEYDDCKKKAEEHGVSLQVVMTAAINAIATHFQGKEVNDLETI